ncbi:hypothetical protein [Streptomyces sp. NPDC002758]
MAWRVAVVAAVERAGYTAELPEPPRPEGESQPQRPGETASYEGRDRLVVTALLSLPVLVPTTTGTSTSPSVSWPTTPTS